MSDHLGALDLAGARVAAVRDDPAARLALMGRVFHGPTGRAPRHLPFRRAALSFMRWQARRGVLNPLDASPPGSVWWRAVNERLLRDGCETIALLGGLAGEPSSQAVRLWLEFSARPTGRNWYRAHNASIVAGYLEHRTLAEAEAAPERFFMNVALARVLYAHALAAAPRLALGQVAVLGRLLGDPRLGMAGVFLSLRRVLPDRYPLALDVERYIADEQRLGRMLDYAVIVPRLQSLYEWSAEELGEPHLVDLVRNGNPTYAWPFEQRHVWSTAEMPLAGRVLKRVTRPRGRRASTICVTGGDDTPGRGAGAREVLRGRATTVRGVSNRFADWIAAYERAWRIEGTASLGRLFTEDATYAAAPFDEPLAGVEAIAGFWEDEREGPDEVFTLSSEIVAAEGDTAVARIEIVYGDPPQRTYRDLWVITLSSDGRCRHFEEWPFHPGQARTAP